VAIADPSAESAAARAAEFGIAATYASAAEMLAAGGLDAVDIAAPRAAHADLVRLAADHGLAVLCQKPLGTTLAEAERLV
ncbi:Gfo/Idh/MocA family oxidoreductase, partial [Enterobacter hormaechei]|uniref:Gfo/Idh/MocA family oxidoreductase n=1 Tax=Enterobacter hormaechei TaxID=158836 RepID=UPI0013D3EBCA